MRPRAPWSGSNNSNCTVKAVAELRRPLVRVPRQQQHAGVQQSPQQQWQQAGDTPALQRDISQTWINQQRIVAEDQQQGTTGSTVAHLADSSLAASTKQVRKRHKAAAGRPLQHGNHQHTQQQQQQQQPQDMNPSNLAAAFLRLLKQQQQQQAATIQQQAHHTHSGTSSSSLPSLQSSPQPPSAAPSIPWDQHYYQQLLQQTQLLLRQLQPRQASLIVYAAAKLGRPPGQPLLAALLQQRLQEHQLQQLPPAGLTNVLWALAVMRYSPEQHWMAGFYSASSNSSSSITSTSSSSSSSGGSSMSSSSGMASLNRHQLCSLLWSLGSLQERPPAEWLQQLLAALRPHLQELQPSELSNVLWGLAQLGYRPRKGWAKEWFRASNRVLIAQGARAAAAAVDADAAGAVHDSYNAKAQSSREQRSDCLRQQQLQQQLEELSGQGPVFSSDHLACIAGSLGLLRLNPRSGHWLKSFRRCVVQQLPRMRGAHVATILCGLAKRRNSQPPHWVWLLVARQLQLLEAQQQQQQQQRTMPPSVDTAVQQDTTAAAAAANNHTAYQQQQQEQLQPADIAATVWALPHVLCPSAVAWKANAAHSAALKALAAASLPLLPSCSAAELVQLAVGFAGLRFYPGAHWLKVHENAVAARYSGMSPANRARLRAAVRELWSDG
jgi:hypothetical protein